MPFNKEKLDAYRKIVSAEVIAREQHPYSYIIYSGSYTGGPYFAKDSNGEIKFSGSDAATVIQSAIDAVSNEGKIFLRQASYGIGTTTIQLKYNDLEFEMEKGGELYYTGPGTAVEVGSHTNVKARQIIKNLCVRGTASGGVGIRVMSRYAKFYNLRVRNFTNGTAVHFKPGDTILASVYYNDFYSPYLQNNKIGFEFTKQTARNNANAVFGGVISGTGKDEAGSYAIIFNDDSGDTNVFDGTRIEHVETAIKIGASVYLNWFENIRAESVKDGIIIAGHHNIFRDMSLNVTGTKVNDTGSDNEYENIKQFVTKNSGTATITGTSGSFEHGLAGVPKIVTITASGSANNNYLGGFSWYPSGSAGVWVVQTGSGTVGFNWYAEYKP